MWFAADAFHFAWKRASGDFALEAAILFSAGGGNPHRKACLMIRQSLDAGSAYADAVLHGDGLASLQFRESQGDRTFEIQAGESSPVALRLEKSGNRFSMALSRDGQTWQPAGGSCRIVVEDPFYIGLGVCAHDNRALEQAVFSRVKLKARDAGPEPVLYSTLETVDVSSKDRRAVYCTRGRIEAPNWTRDGQAFLFNREGRIYRLPVHGGDPELVNTGFAVACNNDHGLSPDGTRLAISDRTEDKQSVIYTLPSVGGVPVRVTALGPSYWHGWSPDGGRLAYCAQRGGEFDIYTIPASGGEEVRLTAAPGLDDGPDYSPDGQFIYFNSERSGRMQVWRMRPDGSSQEPVTADEFNNWFPHPSPDGRWIVFLSYAKDVTGHPPNQEVMLRILRAALGSQPGVLAKLFGGQGTLNVPSWSPDGKKLAFVSYQLRQEP